MSVHDHGTEEGSGLDCAEIVLGNGVRKGACCLTLKDVFAAFSREQQRFVQFLVNATILATAWIDVSEVITNRPDYKKMWSEFKDYEKNVVYALMHDVLNRKKEDDG
jgi:hypothetical protein